jgi:hypothetical protein
VLLALEFLKLGSLAEQALIFIVVLARNLLAQVTIGKPDPEAIWVGKTCPDNLDEGPTWGRAAPGLNSIDPNGGVENDWILIGKDVSENSVIGVGLDHGRHVDLGHFIAHPNVALAPWVWPAGRVNHKGCVLRALHFDDRLQLVSGWCILDDFGGVSSIEISLAKLSIHIEAPSEEDALICEGSNMAETSCTLHEILAQLVVNLDLLRQLNESLVLCPELSEPSLAPTPNIAVTSNGKTEEWTAGNIVNWLAIERFDVLGSTSNLSALADSKLAFKASSPSIHISFVSQNQWVMLTAGNLDDSLVSKWLEDGRSELGPCTSVAGSTGNAWTVGENITVTAQMEGVVTATLDEHQVAHIVVKLLLLNLLGARGGSVLERYLLLLLLVRVLVAAWLVTLLVILRLGMVLTILKGEHLWRLLIVKHMVVVV